MARPPQYECGSVVPRCPICVEDLGKHGGPSTLPCGHNYCLQCLASQQNRNPECPLCRAPFSAAQPLSVNTELRDLIALAGTLHTVEQDGWQTIAATKGKAGGAAAEAAEAPGQGVALMPSAPPLRVSLSAVLEGHGDLLSLEPPQWLPDSQALACGLCDKPFLPLRRLRHHCRLCGGVFCHACSPRALLLPPRFRQPRPQRVCDPCGELLERLQPFLAGTIAQAVQPAVHDVTDASALRSWLRPPLGSSMEADLYKAVCALRAFAAASGAPPERGIPPRLLQDAAGFAVLTTVKVGLGWSACVGTGVVVARRPGGGWSAPSAVALTGLGYGLQLGAAVSDILIVLQHRLAVLAFCGRVQVGGGLGASLALGPVGRQAEASLRLGGLGAALCCSYSLSAGVFAGISIEGSAVSTRDAANLAFYGRPLTPQQLLLEGRCPQPPAAAPLHRALDSLLLRVGATSLKRIREAAAAEREVLQPPYAASASCGAAAAGCSGGGQSEDEFEAAGGFGGMFEE